jgi:hypothetical protein
VSSVNLDACVEVCPATLLLRPMTTNQAGFCDLPLLVVGVPAAVRECLRAAAVPFVLLDGGDRVRGRKGHVRQPRFVLYDSRDAGARRDVDGLRHRQLVSVDLAPSLARAVETSSRERTPSDSTFDTGRPPCPRLLQLLKGAIEEADGLWARVHEMPFPWNYDPPSWRPVPAELLAWRKIRSRIPLELTRTSEAFRIVAAGDFGGFRPAIEIWRGRHVASFELQPGETSLPIGGFVYQQRADRPADPLPAGRSDDSHITVNSGWIKPQSA